MKKLLVAMFVALIMVGCGGGEEEVDLDNDQVIWKGVRYQLFTSTNNPKWDDPDETSISDLQNNITGVRSLNISNQVQPVGDSSNPRTPREGKINDLTLLSKMLRLKTLNAENNQITDLSPLSNLEDLSDVNLNGNQITDLTPLMGLSIHELQLARNKITDLTPLLKVGFHELNLRNNPSIPDDQKAMLRKAKPNANIAF